MHERTAHAREENRLTQPLKDQPVFNNPDVVTEGWYPLCPTRELKRGDAKSFVIGYQRLAAFRGEDGTVRALDAFCPHMGADLGNGTVHGNSLRCYFHQWRFGGDGDLLDVTCGAKPNRQVRLSSYPVEERYGFIWVYAGVKATSPLPACPGLEGQATHARYLGATTLYAHHHVMMAGGIDLAHFGSVHGIDFAFELSTQVADDGTALWQLTGAIPKAGWRAKLGRLLLGERFGYSVRFGAGSTGGITYGLGARLFGTGPSLPSLHVFWGCVPLKTGVSRVHAFVLTPKRTGVFGFIATQLQVLLTVALLALLQDDDVKAFPNMRFQLGALNDADHSVAQFAQYINRLKPSAWSRSPSGAS